MSTPSFANFVLFDSVMDFDDLYERRLVRDDTDGKTLYVAKTLTPNAATDQPVWDVRKLHYTEIASAQYLTRVQKPDGDAGLKYTFDDIETYFS